MNLLKKKPYLWACIMFISVELTYPIFLKISYLEQIRDNTLPFFIGLLIRVLLMVLLISIYIKWRDSRSSSS